MLNRLKQVVATQNTPKPKAAVPKASKPKMITLQIRNYHTTEVSEVSVDPNSTIQEIKRNVSDKLMIPPLKQCLVCKGKKLENEESLTYHGIIEGTLIHLLIKDIEEMTLLVYCPGLRKMKVHLYNKSHVEDLRRAIAKYVPSDAIEFKLLFHGTELEDERLLCDYKLKHKAKIIVSIPSPPDPIPV